MRCFGTRMGRDISRPVWVEDSCDLLELGGRGCLAPEQVIDHSADPCG